MLGEDIAVRADRAANKVTLSEPIFDSWLGDMKLRVAVIDALKTLQRRLEATLTSRELLALPDFYVLLIESRSWGFFHAAETTLLAILGDKFSVASAFAESLIVLDAGSPHADLLHKALDKAFPVAGFGQFICN
jgi:hypothetical protein